MFEKVNPMHPDKIADRIAGAIVDLAYQKEYAPKVAVEVLIGHGKCQIINETSVKLDYADIVDAVKRISGEKNVQVEYIEVPQDERLAGNQKNEVRCGDNGIFKGVPVTDEQQELTNLAAEIYEKYPYDGKYILNADENKLIICQSNAAHYKLLEDVECSQSTTVNPIGYWTGGIDVDTGATNRKLGSDMGDSVTGGGLFGKDLSKADVSVNIYAWLKAQKTGKPVELYCAIGDEFIDHEPYDTICDIARGYIRDIGGFEKFAEWGLIRPDLIKNSCK